MNDRMKQEYDDWVALLRRTNNEDMLKDPYSIWVEAWSLATMVAKESPATGAGQNTLNA